MADWQGAQMDLQASHVAGMIAIGAVLFLLLIERGFRGLKIDLA
jgi:hypothetical protein